jgi:uncharacterized repeat protein (TIGR03843 family)
VRRNDLEGQLRSDDAILDLLGRGELTVTGRLTDASNITLIGSVEADGVTVPCVYKPIRGERPLWDFPDGTLAQREVASFVISETAGWHCVPPTVLREGPYGRGMVQQWIEDADPDLAADLVVVAELQDGWFPVLRAVDADGDPVLLVHAPTPALAVLAGFDLVVNNADRKASHILPTPDGRIRGVDHGVTLHVDDKLRTILWGWSGAPLPESVLAGLRVLNSGLAKAEGELPTTLRTLISADEVDALTDRVRSLLDDPRFPTPPDHRTPIPWPPL